MEIDQALESLPHGPEFRFVEKLLKLDPGKSGKASYQVSGNEHFLQGHFPSNPMWPGVIMIESIAQLGGVIAQCDPEHAQLADVRLTSVKNAKILGTARPGTTLIIEAQIEGRLANMIQIKGTVHQDEIKICSAVVMLTGV